MLFSGVLLKQAPFLRFIAVVGMAGLFIINILEISGISFFKINTAGMLGFDRFALLFNAVVLFSTLVYFILSARDMEKVGAHYGEYFALIFFIICGVVLVVSFKSLLILFLGIEIISIPLYILTGSDKKNLDSILFPLDTIDFAMIPGLCERARTALKEVENGKVSHIIIEKGSFGRADPVIRVYISGERDSGYVEYSLKGQQKRVAGP